jgi:hypothetical protein
MGSIAAWGVVVNLERIYSSALIPIAGGDVVLIIPVIIGLLLFTRLSRNLTWVSRYPQTLMAGVGVGTTMALVFKAQILDPAIYTGKAIFDAATPTDIISTIIMIVGVVSSLIFYTYSRSHTGTYGRIARLGRIFTLCAIGTSMANEYLWSSGVLIERVSFLIDWLRALGIPL